MGVQHCGLRGLANDALPDISAPLTWPAGSFSYRIQQAPSFPPINGYAGRWVPLTTPDVNPERYPGYKQGNSIELRYWSHSAGGPTECIVASQRPLIVESGRLAIVDPPETRADLTQYPGALTLNFGPITHNGVTFVPVGIWARYVTNSFYRSADHYAGPPRWARLAETAVVIWAALMVLV